MPADLTVAQAGSFDEIDRFAGQWDRLAALKRWPFARFAWLRCCAEHLCSDMSLGVHLVLRGDALAGAAALARRRSVTASAELVGSSRLYEANVLLSDGADSAAKLLEHLAALRVPLALSRMLEPDELAPQLASMGRAGGRSMGRAGGRSMGRAGRLLMRRASGAPYLELERSSEDFARTLSGNRRNALARKRRKLASLGSVEFDSTYPDERSLPGYLADFVRIESAGWKGRKGSSISQRTGFHGFFTAALASQAGERRARIDRLTLDGRTVAIQLGLVSDRRYFLIKPTYDEALAEFSPGQQLTYEAIKASIAQSLESYEFLGSEDGWKLQWTSTVRPTRTWLYYPYNARGLVRFGVDAARAVAARL